MAHRGPDGAGFWRGRGVLLGHRRLSIIDLEGGHQPMVLELGGKTHAITYNGEIYNYQHLRRQLSQAGIVLQSQSDTEVLLRLLIERDAVSALNALIGMFAFAWWHEDEQRLLLVRDRLGIKPLYYHQAADGVLSFSSSLESLICHPGIERALNLEALGYVLTLGYLPAPLTLYKGIYELPPGHMLTWRAGDLRLEPYWQLDWEKRFEGSEDDAAEELSSLLDEVVRDHLVSDVPVGAFLSGGLDSSSIVARASRHAGSELATFTIGFPDHAYDESAAARAFAAYLGVQHTLIPMDSMSIDEQACRFVLQQVGQPFLDSSCLPTYLVSRAASQQVKVILSGDGGDELFAGYDLFAWGPRIAGAQRLPQWSRQAVCALLSRLSPPRGLGNRWRALRKGLSYSLFEPDDMLICLKSIFEPEELGAWAPVFGPTGPTLSALRDALQRDGGGDFNVALTRFLTQIHLPGVMLRKVDSMSMAASIEVRVPLLDHRMVEFAQSLPASMKIKRGMRKFLLRRVMQPELPKEVFSRQKWGFAIPLHRMFDQTFLAFCRETLSSPNSQVLRLFSRSAVERILSWNEAGVNPVPHIWSQYTVSHALWILLQFELWSQAKGIALPDDLSCLATI
jgi:asparagine synthase (glutamine-hydrolysing)